jgi:ABC-2 type transport system ATP-binding protein
VLFALAVCGDPDVLFLDEPTVGLDVEARRLLWEQIRKLVERGKTVLLTTHYLEEADALADRVAVINRGEIIAEGTPSEIKARTCGRRIRCVSSLRIETIRAFPGVSEVRRDRDGYEIRVSEAEPVLRELLLHDSTVHGIEVTGAGLEEAFLALTQNDNVSSEPRTSGRQ